MDRSHQASPRGSISAFVVCSVMTMVALAGLAFDGGRVVSTYVEIADAAQNAARMGDQFIVGIRDGRPRIDGTAGRGAVTAFLASKGLVGDVAVNGRTVVVTVRKRVTMRILSIFGIDHRDLMVARTAEMVDG